MYHCRKYIIKELFLKKLHLSLKLKDEKEVVKYLGGHSKKRNLRVLALLEHRKTKVVEE